MFILYNFMIVNSSLCPLTFQFLSAENESLIPLMMKIMYLYIALSKLLLSTGDETWQMIKRKWKQYKRNMIKQ